MINVDTTAAHSGTDTLFDGTLITVRPITSEDASALEAFHGRLSQRSVYLRYFYPHPDLSAKEIEHLTRVDGRDRLALVVEHAGELVAVGRYERLPASQDAEVAFVVSDALQDHGIGTLLLARLAVAARSVGITRFIAEVLAENRGMLSVFFAAPFPTETRRDSGTVTLWMSIGESADSSHTQHGTHQSTSVPPEAKG